jgi:hypothetical protein
VSEGDYGQLRDFYFWCHPNLGDTKHTFNPIFPSPTQPTLSFPNPSSSVTVSEQHRASANGCHHPLLICQPDESAPHRWIGTETPHLAPVTYNTLLTTLSILHLALSQTPHFFFRYACVPFKLSSSIVTSPQHHRNIITHHQHLSLFAQLCFFLRRPRRSRYKDSPLDLNRHYKSSNATENFPQYRYHGENQK